MNNDQLLKALKLAHEAGDVEAVEEISLALEQTQSSEQENPWGNEPAWQRTLKGVGRFGTEIGQGLKQIGLEGGELVGLVDDGRAKEYQQEILTDKNNWEKKYGDDTAANLGYYGATVGSAFLPFGAATKGLQMVTKPAVVGALEAGVQPVYEGDFAQNKALQMASGAALGKATDYGLSKLGNAVENSLPNNVVAKAGNYMVERKAKKAPDFVRQGEELVENTGIELTPGAITGSKGLTFLENRARQSFFSADKAFEVDQKIADQAVKYIDGIADKISNTAFDNEAMGNQLRGAIKGAVNNILEQRDSLARVEYGKIREIGLGSDFSTANTVNVAQEIMNEYADTVGSQANQIRLEMKKVIKQLSTKSKQIKPKNHLTGAKAVFEESHIDINAALKNRSHFSRVSKGTSNLFKDINSAEQRRIGARLANAMEADFEVLAQRVGGDIGEKLSKANDNYRKHMQSIEHIEKSAIGKLMGEETVEALFSGNTYNTIPSERIAEKFLSLKPSELKGLVETLSNYSPETLQSAKAFMIRNALEIAEQQAPSFGANSLALDGSLFINAMRGASGKSAKEGQARIAALFDEKEVTQIQYAIDALERWYDKFGYNFGGTAPVNELNDMLSGRLDRMGSSALQVFGLDKVTQAMNTPSVREGLIELQRLPPSSVKARQYLSYLSAFFANDVLNGVNDTTNQSKEENGGQSI